MKFRSVVAVVFTLSASALSALGQAGVTYTNWLRVYTLPSDEEPDLPDYIEAVDPSGSNFNLPGGTDIARIELWTISDDPLSEILLDSMYVGPDVPRATIDIVTGDDNPDRPTLRTRADQPFTVTITTSKIDPAGLDVSKSVTLTHHVQSYGEDGWGENIDRTLATLLTSESTNENKDHVVIHPAGGALAALPEFAGNVTKVRGEERFSVFSVTDNQDPMNLIAPQQITSRYVQIWPVADGAITGIVQDQVIHFDMPPLSFTLNDLYPDSHTYAQVYPGEVQVGAEGTSIVSKTLYQATPESLVLVVNNDWGHVIPTDGRWTLELLTDTPFGTDRLAYVTFTVDRAMRVNGSISTLK
jgi:hypothetical protein